MSKIKLLVLILFSLFCFCSKKEEKPNYKYFEYSFNTFNSFSSEHTNFSIQIKPNDSIYIRDRKYYLHIENGIRQKKMETYYLAIITKSQRKELNSLISRIPFKEYDTIYQQDCYSTHYATYVEKDSIKKLIMVSDFQISPDKLDSLSKWLNEFKIKSNLIKTNKKLNFITKKYVTIPPSPPLLNENKNPSFQ